MKASTRIALALATVVATAMVVVPSGLAMFLTETGAGAAGAASVPAPVSPIVAPVSTDVPVYSTVPAPSGEGLDWTSFATGLGAAFGMVLLAAVVVVTRRRSAALHT